MVKRNRAAPIFLGKLRWIGASVIILAQPLLIEAVIKLSLVFWFIADLICCQIEVKDVSEGQI